MITVEALLGADGSSLRVSDPTREHLTARLEALAGQVQRAVGRRRGRGGSEQPFRGVFLSDDEIDALLIADVPVADSDPDGLVRRVEGAVDEAEVAGETTRLRALQRGFQLTELELAILLVAIAPDLDERFERFFAYLQDDVTRRRPGLGLALELTGVGPLEPAGRALFDEGGRLVGLGLLDIGGTDRPFLSRSLSVPDRVTAFLLGDDSIEVMLRPFTVAAVPVAGGANAGLTAALRSGTRLVYAREGSAGWGASLCAQTMLDLGLAIVQVDLTVGTAPDGLARALLREAGLRGAGIIVERADVLARTRPELFRQVAESAAVVCLVGVRPWDPSWARITPYFADVPTASSVARAELWRMAVGDRNELATAGAERLSAARLRPAQLMRVVQSADRCAAAEERPTTVADLERAARLLNSVALDELATRVTPTVGWADLILAPSVERSVRTMALRARNREFVEQAWGFGGIHRRRGTLALFAGPPGTGKTLAAEVVAGELGIDLYVVNLATVVDKYIGETEKNLERIFQAAEDVNGLLFFDEADALFGKRSEVRDARDRYANVEVAYLLQRLERFDGTAVLATNLSANLDEAFARRLDVTAEFKVPEPTERRAIWRISLPAAVPLGTDVDLDFLAEEFALSGGSISNCSVTAAYLAAEDGSAVLMEHLVRAITLEYRKLGRLIVANEFGPHYETAAAQAASL